MIWNRTKPTPQPPPQSRLIGVDLNASRLHAVTASGGLAKPIQLRQDSNELPLTLNLETKQIGLTSACRRTPHLFCSNFLNQLGMAREWRGPRVSHSPESALLAMFQTLRTALAPVGDRFALTLPEYLTPAQVKATLDIAAKAGLSLTGSATSALAIAAHRAETLLTPKKESHATDEKPEWVVPLRQSPGGPGVVVIIDVDEAALFASAIEVTDAETKQLASAHWPRASLKLWKDRLLDALADRCVRLCRRDPRDSAEAEQGLFDQLDRALEESRRGHAVTLTARADRWYQDLALTLADFEGFTESLTALAVSDVREMIASLAMPPRAIWLSWKAAHLPGLAPCLHEQSPEGTDVAVLPLEAAAEAAAALDARIRAGQLTATHHDATIAALPRTAKTAINRATIS